MCVSDGCRDIKQRRFASTDLRLTPACAQEDADLLGRDQDRTTVKCFWPGDGKVRRNNLGLSAVIVKNKVGFRRTVNGRRRVRRLVALRYGERRHYRSSE